MGGYLLWLFWSNRGHILIHASDYPVLQHDQKSREKGKRSLSSKSVCTNLAQVVAASLFLPLVNLFGGNSGNPAQGYFWAAVAIGLTVMFFQILNVIMTRKYELNRDGSCREHLRQVDHEKVFAQLKSFGRNRPAIILQIGEVLKQIMQAIQKWNGYLCIYILSWG